MLKFFFSVTSCLTPFWRKLRWRVKSSTPCHVPDIKILCTALAAAHWFRWRVQLNDLRLHPVCVHASVLLRCRMTNASANNSVALLAWPLSIANWKFWHPKTGAMFMSRLGRRCTRNWFLWIPDAWTTRVIIAVSTERGRWIREKKETSVNVWVIRKEFSKGWLAGKYGGCVLVSWNRRRIYEGAYVMLT